MSNGTEISAYVDRLKRLVGVSSDMALAEKIGVAKQTIANWRRRGNIPYAVELKLTDQFGPDAAFSGLTKFTADRRENAVLYATYSYIWALYNKNASVSDGFSIEWGDAFSAMEDVLRGRIRSIGFSQLRPGEVYAVLKRMVREGEIREIDLMYKIYVSGEQSADVEAYLNEGLEGL